MIRKAPLALAAMLLTVGLGACSSSSEEPAPTETNQVEALDPREPAATPSPEPSPTPSATPDTNLTAEAPPEAAPRPDEQMLDDASATGMTARASREEAPATEDTPVEQTEQK